MKATTARRLTDLENRHDDKTAADDRLNERLAHMSDEQLAYELEVMRQLVERMEAAGELDATLDAAGLTRADLYIDIQPDDPDPISTVRKVYDDYYANIG